MLPDQRVHAQLHEASLRDRNSPQYTAVGDMNTSRFSMQHYTLSNVAGSPA